MPHEDGYKLLNRYFNVSRETFSRFCLYHDLLVKWQAKINLIGKDTIPEIWRRHFLDSLQIASLIPGSKNLIVDFGSGAGFPGMVVAMTGRKNIHLVESDGKKCEFLKEAARITETEVFIHRDRIENCKFSEAAVITARAVADLEQLLSYASSHVSRETICLFPKGKNYAKEVEDAKKGWEFDCSVIPSLTGNEGVILKISNLTRR